VASTMVKSSESRGAKDWFNVASKSWTQKAGYRSAARLTNESKAGVSGEMLTALRRRHPHFALCITIVVERIKP
jgi:hypothetical protein